MTETYTADAQAAQEADPFREHVFVKIEFPGYTFLACNRLVDTVIDGDTYVGVGAFGTISVISENADITADPIVLTLNGLDTSVATEMKDFAHQGSPTTISIAYFNSSDVLIDDPVTVFTGVVDTMSVTIGDTLTISAQCDSYLKLLFRGPDGHRRMPSDQDLIFGAGVDRALEYAATLIDDIPWGIPTKIDSAGLGAITRALAVSGVANRFI